MELEEKVKQYFENPRKIKEVTPGENYTLYITFDNGEKRKLEMVDELTGVFAVLRDKSRFEKVFINDVGNIAWNLDEDVDSSLHWENQIDICKDSAYMDSIPLNH
ncbi:MAG: DUF2442 domain-containing protein [Lachnospiraceae bacterium]|nr:DUF2442 domain-containing protein [Lachnospiraceae bacterium]